MRCAECRALFYEYKTVADRYSALVAELKTTKQARAGVSRSVLRAQLAAVAKARLESYKARKVLYVHYDTHGITHDIGGPQVDSPSASMFDGPALDYPG